MIIADVELKPGDIFLTRGVGVFSWAIRFFTRAIGESRTKVNHVGVVVEPGGFRTCLAIEALVKVREHSIWHRYGPPRKGAISVFRPLNLTEDEIRVIVAEAREQVGKKYGILKIVAHFLHWCLFGAYVFPFFARNGKFPICSWLVAHAFAKAGKFFGVRPGAAIPDDIWDFVSKSPERYEQVRQLQPIWSGSE
jgi:hypothetical protein